MIPQSWKNWRCQFGVISLVGIGGAIGMVTPAIAQVQADSTLGTLVNGSPSVLCSGATCDITGGTRSEPNGRNLFHSFVQFSPNGQTVNFAPPTGVQNLFVRVTSGTESNINGRIQAPTNLFLMNPNGIIFGQGASLDIRGSFVATTANAIEFGNHARVFSSASTSDDVRLLTVNPSALFFNQVATQPLHSIEVRGSLSVPENRSLLLVGGNIAPTPTSTGGILLDGGTLNAPGGHVELAGVSGAGSIAFNPASVEPRLVLPAPVAPTNIRLTNNAVVNVQSDGGGDITVYARNLDIGNGGLLRAGIAFGGSPTSTAGNIQIDATETVTVAGILRSPDPTLERPSAIANIIEPSAQGQGGNIHIRTPNLRVTNGGQIFASTFGQGSPGDIFIQADDVRLVGEQATTLGNPNRFLTSAIQSRVEDTGEHQDSAGGVIHIKTRFLSASEGAFISTSTNSDNGRRGNAGNVTIEAPTGRVIFDGKGSDGVASGAYSQVLIGATGNAGAVNISTGELLLRNGAQVSAQTRGGGNAGGLVLTVDSLMVQSGSLVNARTFNNNNAGSLIVRAESVIVEGRDSAIDLDTRSGSATGGDAGILNINTQQLVVQNGGKVTAKTFGGGFGGFMQLNAAESITVDGAGSTLRFETSGTGDAIGISIDTGQLVVTNQGEITVSGTRSGSPGSLIINSGSILMESGGKVTASTLAEIGGDIMITLRPKGLLKMFNGSKIITSALETGDGGRITIRAPEGFVISNGRDKDNDVLAAAKQGRGGLIQAPPRARVFNFIESNVPTPDSDFTAGSETGIPGLTIFEPSREKQPEETIPLDLADPQIAQGCRALRARADESKFIITNRGGLPTNPTEALSGDAVQVDLVTRNPEAENRSGATVSIPSPPKPIVEAQGWVVDRDGTIVLVAHTPTATPAQFWHSQGNCEEVKR